MKRSDRISEEMKKILAVILRDEIRDPRIPLLTSVTEVKVSTDLSHASVYISVFGSEKEKDECFEALKKAASFIRRQVTMRMDLRISPELKFLRDDSIEKGFKMSKLIDETIRKDREKKEDGGKD